jgi:hypothetical protein
VASGATRGAPPHGDRYPVWPWRSRRATIPVQPKRGEAANSDLTQR